MKLNTHGRVERARRRSLADQKYIPRENQQAPYAKRQAHGLQTHSRLDPRGVQRGWGTTYIYGMLLI